MLKGSWAQAVINFDVQAPVTGASVAVFYATGVFFGISGLLILGWQLLRSMTPNLDAAELVMVQDAEDSKQLKVMRLNRNSDKPSGR
ncbi:MAG: TRAP transporter small permease, partial [Burkholderiales bacterium]